MARSYRQTRIKMIYVFWGGPEPNRSKWVVGEKLDSQDGFLVDRIEYSEETKIFTIMYSNGNQAFVPLNNHLIIEVQYE